MVRLLLSKCFISETYLNNGEIGSLSYRCKSWHNINKRHTANNNKSLRSYILLGILYLPCSWTVTSHRDAPFITSWCSVSNGTALIVILLVLTAIVLLLVLSWNEMIPLCTIWAGKRLWRSKKRGSRFDLKLKIPLTQARTATFTLLQSRASLPVTAHNLIRNW